MRFKIDFDDNYFDGIFSYLFGNFSQKRIKSIVDVFASSNFGDGERGDPYFVINPQPLKIQDNETWVSKNIENSSLTIAFKQHQITLASYSMKSRQDSKSIFNCPYEWILEGSNDNISWYLIHHKKWSEEMICRNKTGHWDFNEMNMYSFLKFTQIGENYHYQDFEKFVFTIGTIEFFGTLVECFGICTRRIFSLKLFYNILFTFQIIK